MPESIEVHASALSSYTDCPRQAAAKLYRKQLKNEGYELNSGSSSVAASIGTAVHKMMATIYKGKLNGILDIQEALDEGIKSLDEGIKDGVIWDSTTPHFQTASKQLEALCRAFLPIAELTSPLDYETKREALVSPLGSSAIPIKLIGTRDVRDIRYEIQDHKTGATFPKPHAQLGGYALLAQLNDEEVSGLRINYAKRLGVRSLHEIQAQSIKFPVEECIDAAWNTMKEIQRHYEYFQENKQPWSFPANPMSMRCTPKYCPAFGTNFCHLGNEH